jgi:HEAT repeat protein
MQKDMQRQPLEEFLLKRMDDDDKRIQLAATYTIGELRLDSTEILNGLISALGDNDSDIRAAAVEALGKVGGEQAIRHIIISLGDVDARVLKAASHALIRIGVPAMEQLVSELSTGFLNMLTDGNKFATLTTAIEMMRRTQGDRAVSWLINMLQEIEAMDDSLGRVLDFAKLSLPLIIVKALEEIGTPEALAAAEAFWREHPQGWVWVEVEE